MKIDVHIRYSEHNVVLDKVATLAQEGNLIYNDEGDGIGAHLKTAFKFALLTAASPLITLVRLVRAVAFACGKSFDRARREFIGGMFVPFIAGACLAGTLLSSAVYVLTFGQISFYANMRRTYASFEAWVNRIDLKDLWLPSYAHRVSTPFECMSDPLDNHVWTTAPCMQPLLENGGFPQGGLLDVERMRKIFPLLTIHGIHREGRKVVLESEYQEEEVHYEACDGACEHMKQSITCCCCYRIEAIYDRILCCKVGRGTCTSIADSGDSCGVVSCSICGVGACCCYAQENHNLVAANTSCFGPLGSNCGIEWIAQPVVL